MSTAPVLKSRSTCGNFEVEMATCNSFMWLPNTKGPVRYCISFGWRKLDQIGKLLLQIKIYSSGTVDRLCTFRLIQLHSFTASILLLQAISKLISSWLFPRKNGTTFPRLRAEDTINIHGFVWSSGSTSSTSPCLLLSRKLVRWTKVEDYHEI